MHFYDNGGPEGEGVTFRKSRLLSSGRAEMPPKMINMNDHIAGQVNKVEPVEVEIKRTHKHIIKSRSVCVRVCLNL